MPSLPYRPLDADHHYWFRDDPVETFRRHPSREDDVREVVQHMGADTAVLTGSRR